MVNFELLKKDCYGYYDKNINRELMLMADLSENGIDTIPFTWGMTRFDSLVDAFKQVRKPKRLVVMGCGIGYQCFVWNHLFPDIPCVGIDIFEHRVQWGANMIQKHRIENVTLYSGDMMSLPIYDGDLVWQNNLLFDDELVIEYNQMLLNKKDVQIISYQSIETLEATMLRLGMISNSRDLLFHTKKGFKTVKTFELQVETTWIESQTLHYYFPDIPSQNSFGVEDVSDEFIMSEDEVSTYENILHSRSRMNSDLLKRLTNKNESKKLLQEIGFDVPKKILYTTEQTDLVPALSELKSFVAKPAHWSESVDVHIKRPNHKADLRNISDRLNKRLLMSDMYNWKRVPFEDGIPLKDTERGILVEELIDTVYELKVFVVFGEPLVCDLRTGSNEIYNVDYIRKENKYLDWDKEYELINKLARKIKLDFFRIDFLYDGQKLYANEITLMPATNLPQEISYWIEKRIRTKYLEYYEINKK